MAARAWHDEPDEVEFEHLGYPCAIQRVPEVGSLCGYVAVGPGHPWYERHFMDLDDDGVEVHGGLSYAEHRPGDDPDRYWVGFDCAHAGDLAPGHVAILATLGHVWSLGGVYRDFRYVRGEVERLAEQAHAAALAGAH